MTKKKCKIHCKSSCASVGHTFVKGVSQNKWNRIGLTPNARFDANYRTFSYSEYIEPKPQISWFSKVGQRQDGFTITFFLII